MKKVGPLNGLLAILLGASTLLLIASNVFSSAAPSFSRSRWIAEQQAWGARFSGSVLPAEPGRAKALLDVLAAPARAAGPRNFRVSFDILAPDGSAAEPETQAEPFVALNPEREGHLLAGYQEGRFADGGCRALTWSVSFNGGRTWQEGLLPNLSQASGGPFERVSDPWVAFGPGNRAYYVSLAFNETRQDNGIFVSGSEDGGRTWGDPVPVHTTSRDFDDKETIVVDTRADSPFRGRVYVGWDIVTADRRQILLFSSSTDGGATFRPALTLHDQGESVGIVPLVGPGGVVHAVWLRFVGAAGELLAARSEDGGDTWSAPVTIASVHAAGVPGARTAESLPSAAVDPRTGNLYVVWQDDRFSPGVDQVALSRSTDGGQTWSAPQLVSDGPRDAPNFTPAVAVNAEGLVGVAFYTLRNDPSRRVLVDEYLAVSRNAGRRFGRSQRVSSSSWDVRFAAMSRGFFLGDYQGLAGGRNVFHPLWIATFNASRIDPPARQPDAFTRPVQVK
jgi:hypothetical protein